MFIIRNAVRNIRRSKGRSILIGILITIIAFSSSIGLYIRQASSDSRDAALSKLNITAQITQNRSRAMKQATGPGANCLPRTADHSLLPAIPPMRR